MRHRRSGRHLGRTPSHRRAMFRNMICSLLQTCDAAADHSDFKFGRIVTTVHKAKELRSYVDKLVTIAKRSSTHVSAASNFAPQVKKGEPGWDQWRKSDTWQKWVTAVSPVVALKRRAFSQLRDPSAVRLLFEKVAPRFHNRNGGYTRVVKLAQRRLGDGGQLAILEFTFSRNRT